MRLTKGFLLCWLTNLTSSFVILLSLVSYSADGILMPAQQKARAVVGNVLPTMKILISAIVIFGLNACKQPQPKGNTKTMNFGSFTIETPHSWQQVKVNGIDSDVGSIAIDNKDTLHFDLGWYSNNLTEDEPRIVERYEVENFQPGVDTSEMIIVENRYRIDLDNYKKQNVTWDTIEGREAKIVYPRRSGIGITGIYIDTLYVSNSRVIKFNLYGNDLKLKNEKQVLDVFRTLKFNRN